MQIDLFKIDCEGCEWTTFKDWTGPSIPRIQQILVENHRTNGNTVNFYNELMNNVYVIYHKEPNILKYCKGDCIEYAFLKLDKNFFETKHYVQFSPMAAFLLGITEILLFVELLKFSLTKDKEH